MALFYTNFVEYPKIYWTFYPLTTLVFPCYLPWWVWIEKIYTYWRFSWMDLPYTSLLVIPHLFILLTCHVLIFWKFIASYGGHLKEEFVLVEPTTVNLNCGDFLHWLQMNNGDKCCSSCCSTRCSWVKSVLMPMLHHLHSDLLVHLMLVWHTRDEDDCRAKFDSLHWSLKQKH